MLVSDCLKTRVAIVTGAGGGIGRATALALASLGATVIATDLDGAAARDTIAATGTPGLHTALAHDVTRASDWENVFAAADRAGRLDILVNNAGIMLDTPFATAPVDDLRRQYAINVEGPYIGMQGAIPRMASGVEAGARPAIVNVASVYGIVAGARYAAYSASKGAIRMLSKAVANEVAATGIRVNAVLPGPTATRLGAGHELPRDENGTPLSVDAAVAGWTRLIPWGRMGVVDDIAPVIAFLCSDAAGYITGAEIIVDGGYTNV